MIIVYVMIFLMQYIKEILIITIHDIYICISHQCADTIIGNIYEYLAHVI